MGEEERRQQCVPDELDRPDTAAELAADPVADSGVEHLAPRRRKLSVLATIKAVSWSFFGVRKHSDYEQDSAELNPVVVIVAGLLGGLIFVAVLLTIARMVVRSATS